MKSSFSKKKNSTVTLALSGLALLLITSTAIAIEIGKAAPDFSLKTQNSSLSLQQFQGKLIYLDFWASWCGPCKQSFPWLNEMQEKYAKHGFQVLAINLDIKTSDAQQFLQQHAAQFVVAFDSTGITPKSYGIKGMPSSVLIDRDGRVLLQHEGFRDKDKAVLESQIQTALGVRK